MVLTMVLIGLTGQNAENAHFEKSTILVEFWVKKIKNLPLCRNGVISLFLFAVGETQSAPRFLRSLFLSVFFRSLFELKKLGVFRAPKMNRLSENTPSDLSLSRFSTSSIARKVEFLNICPFFESGFFGALYTLWE